jgi:predicted outer membrane protein
MWRALLLSIFMVTAAQAQARSRVTPATYSDANILALLDEANGSDSTAAAFVVSRATNSDVRSYAQLMMSEHHTLRERVDSVAKQSGVTPQAPIPDPVRAAADSEMSALGQVSSTTGVDTAPGVGNAAGNNPAAALLDKTYIDQELRIHRSVIDLATNLAKQTKNQDIRKLIHDSLPYLERHLTEAQRISHSMNRSS